MSIHPYRLQHCHFCPSSAPMSIQPAQPAQWCLSKHMQIPYLYHCDTSVIPLCSFPVDFLNNTLLDLAGFAAQIAQHLANICSWFLSHSVCPRPAWLAWNGGWCGPRRLARSTVEMLVASERWDYGCMAGGGRPRPRPILKLYVIPDDTVEE